MLAQALAPFGTPDAQRSTERISRVLGAAGQRVTEKPLARASILPPKSQALQASTDTAWGDESKQKKSGRDGSRVFLGIGVLVLVASGVAAVAIMQSSRGLGNADPNPKRNANASAPATDNTAAVAHPALADSTDGKNPVQLTAPPSAPETSIAEAAHPPATSALHAQPLPRFPPNTTPMRALHTSAAASSTGTSPTTAVTTSTARPNCDPPYYFDAKGSRLYKKECL